MRVEFEMLSRYQYNTNPEGALKMALKIKQLEQFAVLTSTVAAIGMASSIISGFYLITPDTNFISVINNLILSVLYCPIAVVTNLIGAAGITIPAAGWVVLLILNSAFWAGAIMMVTKIARKDPKTTAEVTTLVPRWASARNKKEKKAANS